LRPATATHHGTVLLLEAIAVLGLAGLVIYGLLRMVLSPRPQAPAPGSAWHVEHFDRRGSTHVVVRRRTSGGHTILDEHAVATIAVDDAEYDEKFMAAMAVARQRRAVFEAEDD
jgi:hypothetical protein